MAVANYSLAAGGVGCRCVFAGSLDLEDVLFGTIEPWPAQSKLHTQVTGIRATP